MNIPGDFGPFFGHFQKSATGKMEVFGRSFQISPYFLKMSIKQICVYDFFEKKEKKGKTLFGNFPIILAYDEVC